MGDITFGIKLKYDGKELDGGVTVSRQQFRALAVEAKNAGDATSGSFTSAARGVRSVSTQLDELKQGVVGYFTLTKSAAAVRWVLDQASAMQQLDARLKVATASAADYAHAQSGVFLIANKYGAAIGETANAFARLNPVVAQMGGGASTTLKMLDGLSASLRLSGATAAETSAVLTQFAQAMGSGRVGGDEFRSMMENAEPLMRAVAAQMGKTTGELRQMSEEGKLTSSTFGNALLPAIDKLAKQAAEIPLGMNQAWQALENNLSRDFGREFAGSATVAAKGIKAVSDNSIELAAAVHAGADALVALGQAGAVVGAGAASTWAVKQAAAARAATVAFLETRAAQAANTAAGLAAAEADVVRLRTTLALVAADNERAIAERAAASAAIYSTTAIGAQSSALAVNAQSKAAFRASTLLLIETERTQTLLKKELIAAEAAHAAAQTSAAAATSVAGAAARGAGVIIGALGGPIGLVITALTVGATAWAIWGNAAETAADKAKKKLADIDKQKRFGTGEIGDLKADNEKLAKERSRYGDESAYDEGEYGLKRIRDIKAQIVENNRLIGELQKQESEVVAGATSTSRLSAAGEYSKLTADLKFREKLLKEHTTAMLNLQTAYRDKFAETAEDKRPALTASHQQALTALIRQHKQELNSLPEVQDAKDTSAARADAAISAAKASAKRYGDFYKQELDQYRLSTADYLSTMAALERQALTTERKAVASEKPVSDADKIRKSGKLADIDAQLADIDRKRTAAIEDAEDKAGQALARLSVVAGKAIDPVDEASRQFVKEFGATMQRAAADGNQVLLDMGTAAWQAMAGEAQFKTAKERYDALFAELQYQLEAVRQAAERDGGLLAGLAAAGKSDEIRTRLMPAINDAQKKMEASAGGSLVNQKAVTETKRQLGKIVDEGNETWKKFGDQISSSLTDSIYRGFENGKPFVNNLFDSIKNTAKATVLKIGVQAFVDPVMGVVRSAISGSGQAGDASGGIGSLFNTGSNLYNMFNGGSSAAFSSGATSFATSAMGQSMGLSEVTGSYFVNAELATEAVAANTVALTETGSALAGFAGSVGAAMPYIAAAVVVASLLSSKGGGPKSGGDSEAGLFSGKYRDLGDPNMYSPSSANADMTKATSALTGDYLRYSTALGGTARDLQFALGYDTDPQGTAPNRIGSHVKDASGNVLSSTLNRDVGRDSATLSAELGTEAKRMLMTALKNSDLPAAVAAVLSTIDAATATSEQIDKVLALADTFKTLSQILPQFKDMAAEDMKKMAAGVGDNFGAQVADYYQNYFSQTERDLSGLAAAQAQVNTTFAELGRAVPGSMDEFKALAGSLDLASESSQKAFNDLMRVEGTFATIQRAISNLLNNAVAAYINYQSVVGNVGAAQAAGSTLAGINNDKSQDKLAAAFGVDRKTLESLIKAAGGNLGEIAGKYWSQISDAQKAAVTEALSSSAAYISAVKAQWDTQQQIVQAAYNNVARLKDFGSTLDTDVAGLRIAAGQLDQKQYLSSQIAQQQASLDALYSGGASPDELLATAGKLRDLTLQRYNLETEKTKQLSQFAVQVGDYLKGLKVGDLSPLTMGQKLGEAGAQLNDVLLALESGTEAQKEAARAKLTNNADAYLKLAQQYDPSSYATIFAEVQKALTPYADVGTVAEQQLAQQQAIAVKAQATIEQLQALRAQAGGWQATAQVKLDSALASLAPLSAKLDQLGAGGAIETAIRDLPNALASVINAGRSSGATAAVSTAAPATKTYPTGSDATGGLGGSALLASIDGSEASVVTMLTRSRAAGMMPADIAALWNDAHPENKLSTEDLTAWAKQRGIPGFAVGTNNVTEDTLAVIHKRERIMPAADNSRLFEILEGGSNASSDPATVRLLGALLQKMDALIANQERLAALVAESHARSNEAAAETVVDAITNAARPAGRPLVTLP